MGRHQTFVKMLIVVGAASALLLGPLAVARADSTADTSDEATLTLAPAPGGPRTATPLSCRLRAEKPFRLDGVVWTEGVVTCNFKAQYIELQVTLYDGDGIAATDTRQEADASSFRWPLAALCTPGTWYARAQAYVVPPPGWIPGLWGTDSDTVTLTCGQSPTTTTTRPPTPPTTRPCPNPPHCHPE